MLKLVLILMLMTGVIMKTQFRQHRHSKTVPRVRRRWLTRTVTSYRLVTLVIQTIAVVVNAVTKTLVLKTVIQF